MQRTLPNYPERASRRRCFRIEGLAKWSRKYGRKTVSTSESRRTQDS